MLTRITEGLDNNWF